MRLVTYEADGVLSSGVQLGAGVVDARQAATFAGLDGAVDWTSTRTVLGAGRAASRELHEAAGALAAEGGAVRELAAVRLAPPVPDPDKIVCLGLNYRDHAEEAGLALPEVSMLFAKFRNSLVGPRDRIVLPLDSEVVDYEAELALVIGRTCKDVAREQALDYVAGVMALNDVSARDLQLRTSQWMAGKAIDTFAPCGPAIVTLDEVEDIQRLGVRARLNGRTVQDGNTADMIFDVAEIVAYLSRLMTLVPGDIVATGTPAGVGFKREPPLLLKDGDVVEVEIDGVGVLSNPVVGPPSDAARVEPARSAADT